MLHSNLQRSQRYQYLLRTLFSIDCELLCSDPIFFSYKSAAQRMNFNWTLFHFIIYYSLPLQYIYQPFHISQRQNKFLSKNKLENIHYSFIALEKIGYDGLIQWILTLKVNDLKVDKILWDRKKNHQNEKQMIPFIENMWF